MEHPGLTFWSLVFLPPFFSHLFIHSLSLSLCFPLTLLPSPDFDLAFKDIMAVSGTLQVSATLYKIFKKEKKRRKEKKRKKKRKEEKRKLTLARAAGPKSPWSFGHVDYNLENGKEPGNPKISTAGIHKVPAL